MAFGIGNVVNSHNFQYLSQAASHNIRYPLYQVQTTEMSFFNHVLHHLSGFGTRMIELLSQRLEALNLIVLISIPAPEKFGGKFVSPSLRILAS